ncbi:MAG: hypothetical protein JWN24_3369 [Phycisphaerales bacterium]|nr:hypothetical protein [Phycisphaerales bacterium]
MWAHGTEARCHHNEERRSGAGRGRVPWPRRSPPCCFRDEWGSVPLQRQKEARPSRPPVRGPRPTAAMFHRADERLRSGATGPSGKRKPCGSSPDGGLPSTFAAERCANRESNRGATAGDKRPARFPRTIPRALASSNLALRHRGNRGWILGGMTQASTSEVPLPRPQSCDAVMVQRGSKKTQPGAAVPHAGAKPAGSVLQHCPAAA